MKKIVFITFFLFMGVVCFAQFETFGGDFTRFNLNKNFYMVNSTYKYTREFDRHFACFVHPNYDKKTDPILHRRYIIEYACAEWIPAKGNLPFVPLAHYYFEDERDGFISDSPDYFGQEEILYDIEAFFVNLRDI